MTAVRTVTTIAALTLREATRRRVVLALGVLTAALVALSGYGFSRLAAQELTTGELRLASSGLLNLVMFGFSLIAALGTAFVAGPTLSGEMESGISLAVLARPVRRSAVLLGKWVGLVVFGGSFVVLAGLAQCLVVRATVDHWPPDIVGALALLVGQSVVLLTLAMLLSTTISPMASGVVAVGLFGAAWVGGVVGSVGAALGNDSVARVGTVSQMLLPTDGLWRGAMFDLQHPAIAALGGQFDGHPLLSDGPVSFGFLGWTALWVAMIWGLAALSFVRKDL